MRRKFNTSAEVYELLRDKVLIDPPTWASAWRASRLVLLQDGSTVPLLELCAEHKFGLWNRTTHRPYWKDKDPTNESLENVELEDLVPAAPRREPNQYGVPSGSREYYRRYRAAHKEKFREYSKAHYAKLRAAYRKVQGKASEHETRLAEKASTLFESLGIKDVEEK